MCHGMSRSISFCSNGFTYKCSLQWVIGLQNGLQKPLASTTPPLPQPPEIPLGYHDGALSRGDPVALVRLDWPLPVLQQLLGGIDSWMN